jgi:hypothetical protein
VYLYRFMQLLVPLARRLVVIVDSAFLFARRHLGSPAPRGVTTFVVHARQQGSPIPTENQGMDSAARGRALSYTPTAVDGRRFSRRQTRFRLLHCELTRRYVRARMS